MKLKKKIGIKKEGKYQYQSGSIFYTHDPSYETKITT